MELLFVNWKQNHICSDWLEGKTQLALHAKEIWVAHIVATCLGHILFLCALPWFSLSLPPFDLPKKFGTLRQQLIEVFFAFSNNSNS